MIIKRIIGIGWDVGGWMGDKQGLAVVQWDLGSDKLVWLGKPSQTTIPVGTMFTLHQI